MVKTLNDSVPQTHYESCVQIEENCSFHLASKSTVIIFLILQNQFLLLKVPSLTYSTHVIKRDTLIVSTCVFFHFIDFLKN
jgi:hypothetical protein